MIAESINRQINEGFGGAIKNGFQKIGRMGQNYMDKGEFKDPQSIQNPLEKWFYNHGWKLTKMGNGAYRCQSLMGTFGKMPQNMLSKDEIINALKKANPNKDITVANDTEFKGDSFGNQATNGRVDYEYGSYSESFIFYVRNPQMSVNGRQRLAESKKKSKNVR